MSTNANDNTDSYQQGDTTFGGCPTCGGNNGHLNVGKGHWFFCDEHPVTWCAGANLFSTWQGETEAEQREKYKRIEDYAEVKPIYSVRDEPKLTVITSRSDPDRWRMEMIDGALDGLDTLQRLLDAKLTDHALNKLFQVRGDLEEVRKHLLGLWSERVTERARRLAAAHDDIPF